MVEKGLFWLMEVVVNSYILYKCSTLSPSTHREYQLSIIRSLASEFIHTAPPRGPGRRRASHRKSRAGDPDRLNRRPHFLDRTTGPRDCVVCSNQSCTHPCHLSHLTRSVVLPPYFVIPLTTITLCPCHVSSPLSRYPRATNDDTCTYVLTTCILLLSL